MRKLGMLLRGLLPALLLTASACGGGGSTVTVNLTASSMDGLDPYEASTGISLIRVTVVGLEHDNAVVDLMPSQAKTAVFEDFKSDVEVEVRVEGLDDLSNLVAFGRVVRVDVSEDVTVTVPFRRNLAYVTHRHNSGQRSPAGQMYLIDMATRTYVMKVALPGSGSIGRMVTPRGGDSMLVTYQTGAEGFLGILNVETNEWSSIKLQRIQDLALGSPAHNVGIVAGGGALAFVDFDQVTLIEEFAMPIGGRALDGAISADGRHAVVVLDSPAMLYIDLVARTVRTLSILQDPSGVALAGDGRLAYATSNTQTSVAVIDLDSGVAADSPGGFKLPVEGAAFSDELQAVMGLSIGGGGIARVLGYLVPAEEALDYDTAPTTLPFPTGIAADPSGKRLIVVAAGSSTATAGLTVIDTFRDALPQGSSALYPTDPDDTYTEGRGFVARQRYQPSSVGVIYGR